MSDDICWLMKAEPDSRIVKGKDVKFSVDDFETVKTSPWEGVRNHEARNLMKDMKVGQKVLFYHSNCKTPGIAAFAEVSKEAYPDYTAWDSSHPYYDPKTEQASPKWFMVDLTFTSRAVNFISLALLKHIASLTGSLPDDLAYIGPDGAQAIKNMDLINRGRLSVQRVQKPAWDVITLLAERGGWNAEAFSKAKRPKPAPKAEASTSKGGKSAEKGSDPATREKKRRSSTKAKAKAEDMEEDDFEPDEASPSAASDSGSNFSGDATDDEYGKKPRKKVGRGKKRKAVTNEGADERPSTRSRTRRS